MDNDFAVFIMVWGRPDKMWTYQTLRRHGYTGKVYFVADDLDKTLKGYRDKYGDDLLVFSKTEVQDLYDSGDNTGDLRSTMYAANIIPELAKKLGYKYFFIFCDDYTNFEYKMDGDFNAIHGANILNLDRIFEYLLDYYKSIPALSVAFAQGGDFLADDFSRGFDYELGRRRKVMNTFLCSTERPFEFVGRMNEDVTTCVNLGNRGCLFLTYANIKIEQNRSQSEIGGLTDLYIDYGTYVKSFFTVMYNPSSVHVSVIKSKHKRLHHSIKWDNAVPCIISEDYRKLSNHARQQ